MSSGPLSVIKEPQQQKGMTFEPCIFGCHGSDEFLMMDATVSVAINKYLLRFTGTDR